MKLNNLQKYTSANLLSVFGYFSFAAFCYLIFVYVPHDALNTAKYAQDLEMAGFDAEVWSMIEILLSTAVFGLLTFCSVVEFFIRKKTVRNFFL